MKRRFLKLAITLCLILSFPSHAEIKFNGFLSAGGGLLIDDDEITSYIGFDDKWGSDPDTTFGLQVTSALSDKITATGQFLAQGNNDYNVEAEWAYVAYTPNDNWNLRVGRLRAPFFVYSDFLDVGYAYPWIRPPSEVYRFVFSTVEGVDAMYSSTIGYWDSSVQVYYGRLTDETNLAGSSVDLDLEDFFGVNWTLNKDWLTLRATYNRADVTIDSPASVQGLLDALNGLGFSTVADALAITEEDTAFWGVGIGIDYGNWIVNSEYTEIIVDQQSLITDDNAWYLMVGRRYNDFTFHITYEAQESDPDLGFIDAIPAGIDPALDGLRATVAGAVGTTDDEVITIGFRYDFAPSTAFKIEYADIEQSGRNGSLLSFTIDVVF